MAQKRSSTAAAESVGESDDEDTARKRAKIEVRDLDDVRELEAKLEEGNKEYAAGRATEARGKARAGRARDGSEPFGVIKELTVHDFMCHHHLHFKFGTQINFVIGHNGSGKSAIQTAITIALGGKTAATGRANSMKDLVRTGADQAKIVLVMHNRSEDAFKPDVYGDEITIERTINREQGGTTWRLRGKRHGNKIMSTKKAEIDDMCSAMGIQIDNTLTTLSQDQSRAFLANSDAYKKYALFLQGTGLARLVEKYQELDQIIWALDRNIEEIKSRLPDLMREQTKWREMHESLEMARRAKEELLELKYKQCWAYVKEKEKNRDESQFLLDKQTEKVANTKIMVKNAEHEVKEAEDLVTKAEQSTSGLQAKFDALNGERQVVEADVKTAANELRGVEGNLTELLSNIKSRDTEIATYTEKRNAELARHGNAELDEQRKALQETVTKTQVLLAKIEREREVSAAKRREKARERDDVDVELSAVNNSRNALQGQISTVDRNIEALRRSADGTDSLAMYGHNIQAVKQEIARSQWRKGPPLGPLGTFVKIKPGEQDYSKIINQVLWQNFHAWAVTDYEDKQQLQRIFQMCMTSRGTAFEGGRGKMPTIITHTGEVFNYSGGDWRQYHPTILSKLEFKDPRVERIFINSNNIEKLFLTKTRAEADVVVQRLQIPGFPNVISVDKFRVSRTNQSGAATSIFIGDGPNRNCLTTDVRAEIEAAEQEKQNLQQQLAHVQEQGTAIVQRKQAIMNELQELDKRDKRMATGHVTNQTVLRDAQSKLDEVEPADVSVFTNTIEAAKAKRETEIAQLAGLTAEKEKAVAELAAKKGLRDGIKTRKDALFAELNQCQGASADALAVRTAKIAERTRWLSQIRAQQETLRKVEADTQQLRVDYDSFYVKATEFCAEVEVEHEAEWYLRKIDALKKSLANQQERLNVDLGQVVVKLNDAVKKVNDQKTLTTALEDVRQNAHAALKQRQNAWQRMREALSTRTDSAFRQNLLQRAFHGKLMFDHAQQALHLEVTTQVEGTQDGAVDLSKTARQLSGGETSYSTICLLLALWESVTSPIKCLDEFDVFMDAHNRALSISMLVNYAKQRKDRQYILITPQDMSNVQLGPAVQVHKMPDPKRAGADQTRLEFRPAEG